MLRALFLFVVFVFAARQEAAAAPSSDRAEPLLEQVPEVRVDMPLQSVRHNQRGRCFTVFEGRAIEPFDFVVKGIMRDYLGPKSSVILVRLEGEKVEFSGVVAGMSGSPCFIDGKLIGALSYAFASFAKEPIAGITPIADMTKLWREPSIKLPWRLDNDAAGVSTQLSNDEPALKPIASPLSVGGCPEVVRKHFEPAFAAMGMGPMLGSARASDDEISPLMPGSPVAVVLVRGDMDMAATGTVTWVDGTRVLALGHPFLGGGQVSFPMAEASILNTMASQQRSFKMAATGRTIGEVTQDRLSAIAGVIGQEPQMLPVTGALFVGGREHTFALEVARDLAMTPKLVAMGLASALSGRVEARNRGTIKVTSTLSAQGHAPVILNHVFAAEHDDALLMRAAIASTQALVRIWDTPFGPPPKMRVDMRAELIDEPIEERVEALSLDRVKVRAGDTVKVTVKLRQRGKAPHFVCVPLEIPLEWSGHTLELIVGGPNEAQAFRSDVEGSMHAQSVEDVLAQLRRSLCASSLHLMVARGGVASYHRTKPLGFVPPSAVTLWSDLAHTELRAQGMLKERSVTRPGQITGSARKTLVVAPRL